MIYVTTQFKYSRLTIGYALQAACWGEAWCMAVAAEAGPHVV